MWKLLEVGIASRHLYQWMQMIFVIVVAFEGRFSLETCFYKLTISLFCRYCFVLFVSTDAILFKPS